MRRAKTVPGCFRHDFHFIDLKHFTLKFLFYSKNKRTECACLLAAGKWFCRKEKFIPSPLPLSLSLSCSLALSLSSSLFSAVIRPSEFTIKYQKEPYFD